MSIYYDVLASKVIENVLNLGELYIYRICCFRRLQDLPAAMRGVRGAGDLHVRLGVSQDRGPAPGHVHGRLHVRQLLRARHQREPHRGPSHNTQGEVRKLNK